MRTVLSLLFASITLVGVSEFLYYPVRTVDPLLVGYYVLPTACLLWALRRYRVDSLAGVALVGAVYGFTVEGLLVPVLYESPLFTISYTSLAWHMAVAVMACWWTVGRGLREGPARRLAGTATGLGLMLGAWWPAWWLPGAEQIDWTFWQFTGYIGLATLLLALGHVGLALFPVSTTPPGRAHTAILAVVAVVFWIVISVQAPLAVVLLPALLWICRWGLRRQSGTGSVLTRLAAPIRWRRLLILALVPAGAGAGYGIALLVSDALLVADLSQALVGGGQWIVGYVIFAWALLRRRHHIDYDHIGKGADVGEPEHRAKR